MTRFAHRQTARFPAQSLPLLSVLAMSMGQAFGQASPNPAAEAAKAAEQDQTVTSSATRRKELIRNVPVALTKISTDAQLDLGAKVLTDMLQSVSGVYFIKIAAITAHGELVIRGVSTGIAPNPTVAVYIDDVLIGGVSGASGGTHTFDQRCWPLAASKSSRDHKAPCTARPRWAGCCATTPVRRRAITSPDWWVAKFRAPVPAAPAPPAMAIQLGGPAQVTYIRPRTVGMTVCGPQTVMSPLPQVQVSPARCSGRELDGAARTGIDESTRGAAVGGAARGEGEDA